MTFQAFLPYLLVMGVITYLLRAVPLAAIQKKIENPFIISFLYYMPYAVLSVMTIPSVFYAAQHWQAATCGVIIAVVLAYFRRGLITVALGASLGVLAAEWLWQTIVAAS